MTVRMRRLTIGKYIPGGGLMSVWHAETQRSLAHEGCARSPADFRKLIAEETEKWGKVIRAANIKAE